MLVALLVAVKPHDGFAQQDPLYTMYMWNMMAINPAYAGSADVLNVTALTRAQWRGLAGAPTTHSFSAHAPVNKNSLGTGISMVSDRIGRTGTTSVFGDISYRFHLSRKVRMAWGLKMGFNHAQVNNTQVENTHPDDPTFASDLSGAIMPNFGVGSYIWSQKAYFGISIPKLYRNQLAGVFEEQSVTLTEESPHLFVTGGMVFGQGSLKFKPAFMMRITEGAPISGDLSANFLIRDRLWLGAALRNCDSGSMIFSLQMNDQFRMGYAYDIVLTGALGRTPGSHELMISYDPVFNRERIRSPRYF